MSDTLTNLLDLLTLESIGTDRYLGQAQDLGFPKLFGGHVLGQSLVAATNSCQGLQAHSLHAYFIRAGSSTVPIEYQVDRLRDGKSISVRRVTALQNNQAILILSGKSKRQFPQRRGSGSTLRIWRYARRRIPFFGLPQVSA